MKILYLHQYFKTPVEGGSVRSWHIAKGMVKAGHDVVMITSHNENTATTKIIDGITVHYLPVFYDNKLRFAGRIFSFIRFVFLALKKSKQEFGIDLCYATSTPLTIGIIAYVLKRTRSVPYVFEVRDLWPEAPMHMGVFTNFFVKKLLYKLEKLIYNNASSIVALSPGIQDGIKKVCPDKKIALIPNMADCDFFHPEIKDPLLEDFYSVEGKFVVSYYGAAGSVNNLSYLADIIKYCKDHNRDDIYFLIQAKGSELQKLKVYVESLHWPYVQFLGYSGKNGLKNLLNVTDAVYISFDNKPVLQTNSPNKFFDAIAAGKLTIVNTKGWIKDLIEKEEIGIYVNPMHAGEFIKKTDPYIHDKTRLLAVNNKARRVAENFYSKEILINRLLQELNLNKINSSSTEAYNRIA